MAATLVISGNAYGSDPVTTGNFNTTGSDFIVAFVAFETTFSTSNSLSDNKGNTWTSCTLQTTGQAGIQAYYSLNPTVGSGHNFTATGRNPCIMFEAWSSGGTPSFGSENGNTDASVVNNIQTGSVTLSTGDVAVAGVNSLPSARTVTTVDSGFTLDQTAVGFFFGAGDAYLIAAGNGAVNPKFTLNFNDLYLVATIIAITISGGGSATSPMRLPLLGVN